ncbi:Helix-turn-helix domain [Actinomadura madurae]|nr:Helix-turn-helix domain [Actinomadura madurae]
MRSKRPVDAYNVRAVVSELVSNAVRHAVTDEVRVDAYADGDVYVVTVWDGWQGRLRRVDRRLPKCPPTRRTSPRIGDIDDAIMINGWDFGPGQLLTPGDVATMFRVAPKTVTRWADDGKPASVRALGGVRRFSRRQVEHLIFGGGAQ